VPPGTQPGRKFRVKGLGIEKGGRKGDQLVAVQVQIPEKLNEEQEELLKKFAEAGEMQY
jgi:molecular chaperone DnaJ